MNLIGARKQGKKFLNPIPTHEAGFDKLIPILKEYINNKAESVPKKPLGPFNTNKAVYQTLPDGGLRITWLGHSSLLIEIDGIRILTDPVWSERVSFSAFFGPKRFFAPPLALEDLPPLDVVIVSHDHYDHLDRKTIKFFTDKNIQFITPLGVSARLESYGISKKHIHEVDWGDSLMIGSCHITATPARHFSGRGIVNRNETLWASFVIKGPQHNIFYGADSGWFPGFADIGEAFGPFDLTMLEIGAYGDNWPDIHMGPDKASNAHLALKGNIMMPIHWGTFNLALHAWFEPVEKLIQYSREKNIMLFLPEPGQPVDVNASYDSEWWKRYMS